MTNEFDIRMFFWCLFRLSEESFWHDMPGMVFGRDVMVASQIFAFALPDPQELHLPFQVGKRCLRWKIEQCGTLWKFNIAIERSTIFNGKIHY